MSITVSDCLELPSLREAKVVGGAGGTNRSVSCVSALEHVDLLMLKREGFFLGNQLIISALTSVKDDVEVQCQLIQLLSDSGEAGLIVYYVGIFVAEIDAKLIQLADQLDFPLIIMPPNRYNHRYSDFISEAMTAIVDNQRQETNIVPGIIDQIAHFKPHLRNMETALRILSDRLRCSLLLTGRNENIRAFASWPLGAEWDEDDLNSIVALWQREPHFDKSIEIHINGMDVQMYCTRLDTEKQKGFFLVGIDESGNLNATYLSQAAEALQLLSNIWENIFEGEGTDELLRAVLNNRPGEMKRIAHKLRIDIASFDTMWVFWNKRESGPDAKTDEDWLAQKLEALLKGNEKSVMMDVYKGYVVAFLDSKCIPFLGSPEELMAEIRSLKEVDLIMFDSFWLKSTEEVRASFSLMEENIKAACILYPHQNIFTQQELHFVQTCCSYLESSEIELQEATQILDPLLLDEAGKDVIDTLVVYLLDCHGNILETSNRLFVHKNTVKYRIKKAEHLLGFDVMKMPESMSLYTALAIMRLLSSE